MDALFLRMRNYLDEMGVSGIPTFMACGTQARLFWCDDGRVLRITMGSPGIDEFLQACYFSHFDLPIAPLDAMDIWFAHDYGETTEYFVSVRSDIPDVPYSKETVDLLDTLDWYSGLQEDNACDLLEMAECKIKMIDQQNTNPNDYNRFTDVLNRFRDGCGLVYADVSISNFGTSLGSLVIRDPYAYYGALSLRPLISKLSKVIQKSKLQQGNLSTLHREVPGFTVLFEEITSEISRKAQNAINMQSKAMVFTT